MTDIIKTKLREWVQGKSPINSRIEIFNRIRDIPYAVIPDLNNQEHYAKILELNRGSCMPKHFLLADMYNRLGLPVLFVVYPYRCDQFEDLYPPNLIDLAREMPTSFHLACKVEIEGRLVCVDATLDSALAAVGLPVNYDWDGISNALLPINPCGQEHIYHPSEAHLAQTQQIDKKVLRFYDGLNSWLDKSRTETRIDSIQT